MYHNLLKTRVSPKTYQVQSARIETTVPGTARLSVGHSTVISPLLYTEFTANGGVRETDCVISSLVLSLALSRCR